MVGGSIIGMNLVDRYASNHIMIIGVELVPTATPYK